MEMVIVFIGNVIVIVIFWRKRLIFKWICYFLINFLVVDFLVGIGEIMYLYYNIFYFMNFKLVIWDDILILLDVFVGLVFLLFLIFIFMERLYVIVWFFYYRMINMRVYFNFIVVIWILLIGMVIIFFCSLVLEIISLIIFILILVFVLGFCLVVILSLYLVIWWLKRNEVLGIFIDRC